MRPKNSQKISSQASFGKNVGASLPILCAIHCMATPFILSALPLLSLDFLASELFEWLLIGLSALLAFYILSKDILQSHGQWFILLIASAGFALVIAAHLLGHELWWLPVLGALCIMAAYFINWHYLRKAKCCRVEAEKTA